MPGLLDLACRGISNRSAWSTIRPMPITVFVADDHAIVRDGLVSLLSAHSGFEVVGAAASGRDAVDQVLRLGPRVAILDISMPDLTGIEAALRIRASRPDVAIVILTMHAGAQYVFQALEAGVRGYLLKESASLEIIDAVRTVDQGRRYLSAKVTDVLAEGISERRAAGAIDSLSRREREILQLVVDGCTSNRIGAMLHLSPKTVDSYRSRLMHKLQVTQLAGLVKFAIQHGLTTIK